MPEIWSFGLGRAVEAVNLEIGKLWYPPFVLAYSSHMILVSLWRSLSLSLSDTQAEELRSLPYSNPEPTLLY